MSLFIFEIKVLLLITLIYLTTIPTFLSQNRNECQINGINVRTIKWFGTTSYSAYSIPSYITRLTNSKYFEESALAIPIIVFIDIQSSK